MSIISGFKFNKGLGQNFILDEGMLESIVAELGLAVTDTVVEIGTGAGTLTRVLARKVARVVTYELDKRLVDILAKQFKGFDNIELRFEDGLRANICAGGFVVVANIPYYITTPLIWKFMADPHCARICVLVQDDVARRIVAKPGGKDYGALSVGLQARADCRIVRKVPRGCFVPVPGVDSAFVTINKFPSQRALLDPKNPPAQLPFKIKGCPEGGVSDCSPCATKPVNGTRSDTPSASRPPLYLKGELCERDLWAGCAGGILGSSMVQRERCLHGEVFDKFLKQVFSARRKTILNALGVPKDIARKALLAVGIDENLRPEQIAPDKFAELSTKLSEILEDT